MSIKENIERVRERIALAEAKAGRKPGSASLMAVSKFHPATAVRDAIGCGITLFGENRVQEAEEKFPEILSEHEEVALHLIGSLQRNKVSKIVRIATCVQSIDRAELLTEIERQASATSRVVDALFEYRTGEDSKSGYLDRESLFRSLDLFANLSSVRCRGLMTMAPFTDDRAAVRGAFRTLVSVQGECARRYPSLDFSVLSMGMSADFEIAIEEGSTLVRVGTAIFGERQ